MIHLNKIEGTDIFEFSIKGDIDKESIENFYKLLELKAENNQKIKLLGTILEFPEFENFSSFTETLKMKKKAIETLSRYAILSDKDWLENLLPFGNFLTPRIQMKHFGVDEREEAIAWLKKDEDKSYPEKEYLSKMNIEIIRGTNIYSFSVNGKIDEGGMSALYNILKDKSRNGKIKLLAFYKNFDGFDSFKAFTEGLKVDFAGIGNIEKFAIVTDKNWVKNIAEIESKILPGISIKTFAENEEEKALTWLNS